MLPARYPIGYDPSYRKFVAVSRSLAVAAFTPPGFTLTHSASYEEALTPKILPLFAYGAAVLYKGEYHTAAVRVDADRRHDSRFIDMARVRKNVAIFRKLLPENRLARHLEDCALKYSCPNAQNFFLSRYECPLPTSPSCNAACSGCISYQTKPTCSATQPRIRFIPTPEEVAQVALFHIRKVKDPIVSFGQGCEGEPLLAGDIIEQSIRLIRKETAKGIININTNASRPQTLIRLLDAGLDSIRVSMNSGREVYYTRYYKPKGYAFADVLRSIKVAKGRGAFVSLNYLTMSGFTDQKDEFRALTRLIEKYHIDMIQWRNLNFDPLQYFKELRVSAEPSQMLGIREIMQSLRKRFPRIMMGYFNPSMAKMKERR